MRQIQEWFGCSSRISPTPASSAFMVCLRRKTLSEFELSAARKLQSWNTSNFELPSCPLSLSGTSVLKLCSRARLQSYGRSPSPMSSSLGHPDSPIPRGQLTQLVIVNDGEKNSALGDSNDLVDLPVNCPALEILRLDFCVSSQLTRFPRG